MVIGSEVFRLAVNYVRIYSKQAGCVDGRDKIQNIIQTWRLRLVVVNLATIAPASRSAIIWIRCPANEEAVACDFWLSVKPLCILKQSTPDSV